MNFNLKSDIIDLSLYQGVHMKIIKRIFAILTAAVMLTSAIGVPRAIGAETAATEYVYERVDSIENGGVYAVVVDATASNNGVRAVSNIDREVNKGLFIPEVTITGDRLTSIVDSGFTMDNILWSFEALPGGGYSMRSLADNEYAIITSQSFLSTGEVNSYAWEYTTQENGNHVVYNINRNQYMTIRGTGTGFMDVSYWPTANHEYMLFKRVAVGNIPVTGVTVTPESLSLLIGEQRIVSAQVMPVDASDRSVSWESSNTDVASVNENGLVTAVGVGTATVSAITNDGGFAAECDITVLDIDLEGTIFGYKLYEPDNVTGGFISFDVSDLSDITYHMIDVNQSYLAGEFYNGCMYMYTVNGEIAAIDTKTWQGIVIGKPIGYSVCDMAYDYETDTMFAFGAASGGEYLLSIDILTGAATRVAPIVGVSNTVSMACSTAGQLYLITADGGFYALDKTTGRTSFIGNTGRVDVYAYYQSAFYDHNSGTLYWVQEGASDGGMLNIINTETGEANYIGKIGEGIELIGGFMHYYPDGVPETYAVEGICIDPTLLNLEIGDTRTLKACVLPVNATEQGISFTSTDTSVAVVDANGVVTAVGTGTSTIIAESVEGNFTAGCTVNVSEPTPPTTIYGYLYYINSSMGNGADFCWASFSSDNPGSMTLGRSNGDYYTESAEYYNGYVYGYDSDGEFFYIDIADNWRYHYPADRVTVTGTFDMAYDYSTNTMFCIREDNRLYRVSNMSNGEQELVAPLPMRLWTLCCSTDGTLYGIAGNGYLYTVDKTNGQLSLVGSTGRSSVYFRQSMAYDHNTGKIYWSAFNTEIEGHLIEIDPMTGEGVDLGVLQYNADITGMFIPYDPDDPDDPSQTPAPTSDPTPPPTSTPTPTASPVPPTPPADLTDRLIGYCTETVPNGDSVYSWFAINTNDVNDVYETSMPPYILYSAVFCDGVIYAYDEYGFMLYACPLAGDEWEWMPTGGYCAPYLVYDMDMDPNNGTVYCLVYADGYALDQSQFAGEGYFLGTADLATGALTECYRFDDFLPVGISCIGNGRFIAVDSLTNRIVEFDANGNYTLYGDAGFSVYPITQSLTYDFVDGLVYWSAVKNVGGTPYSMLCTIDPETHTVNIIGETDYRFTCLLFLRDCPIVDPTPDPTPTPGVPGDVNGDGVVTAADANLAMRMALSLIEPNAAADANGDGTISIADANIIMRWALNL